MLNIWCLVLCTFWVIFRRKLKHALCFLSFLFIGVPSIWLQFAVRDKIPSWFNFQADYSDNIFGTLLFYFVMASLLQPFDFKVTLFGLSPILITH